MDVLGKENLERIYMHACRTYPEECCGLVFADGTVHTGTNIQNELNAKQPDVYQRDATCGYTFSVADNLMLHKSLRSKNPAAVIYHSHPDVGAYFSDEDRDKALFLGEPIYPVRYLVIDVRRSEIYGAKLFEWRAPSFVCTRTFQP